MNSYDLSFQKTQTEFCQWIRSPTDIQLNECQQQRLQIYHELIYNNICSFIDVVYPITRSLLPESLWQELCQDFFQNAQCDSPFYNDISLQFKEYIAKSDKKYLENYPWLMELLQFEWLELYLDTMELEEKKTIHQQLDEWYLNATVWILIYQYPVYQWYEGMSIAQIKIDPNAILAWRDERDQIFIHPISPIHALLIEQLNTHPLSIDTLEAILLSQLPMYSSKEYTNILDDLKFKLKEFQLLD